MTMMNLIEKYKAVLSPDGPGGGGAAPASAPSGGSPSGSPPSSQGTSGAAPGSSGGDGVSPSPATSTPSPSPGATPDLDFSALFGTESSGLETFSKPATPAAPTAEPPAEPTLPPTAAPVEAAAAVEPGAQPAQPAAAAVPETGTPPTATTLPQLDPYDPAALGNHLAQNEALATQFVAEQMFQLSPEEREALEQDVIGTVPKLLAKVFVKSQQNVLNQLGRLIPVMIQRQTAAMTRNTENEGKFYSRWPDIKKDQHHDLVTRYATVYRQMHPNATLDQMIEDLGPMVMLAGRIAPSSPGAPGRSRGQAPSQGANGRPPQPSPFVPATSGPVAQPQAPQKEPWEVMFEQP